MNKREQTRTVWIGKVPIGGGHPIVVQSMTKTDTRDAASTLKQIRSLAATRCLLVRVAVPDREAAAALQEICRQSPIPIIADIHFDYRLALAAVDAGVSGLRINPGTIGSKTKVAEIAAACRQAKIPIRVGANSGSLPRELLGKYGGPTAEAMVEACLNQVHFLNDLGFNDIKVSLKSSDLDRTYRACVDFAQKSDLPIHLGITEAGGLVSGTAKSAIGIGRILSEGIGDTIRVSLTDDPIQEVRAGYAILRSLKLAGGGIEVISCPTCSRTDSLTMDLAKTLEEATLGLDGQGTVAVMGCPVNGPGESRQADLGVVAVDEQHLDLYQAGQLVKRVSRERIVDVVLTELNLIINQQDKGDMN